MTHFSAAAGHLHFVDLGLRPVAFSLGPLPIRWYSLAYITGIVLGWGYLLRLLRRPAAPMSRAQADDLVFYATLGVIIGGRLGYVLFYGPWMLLQPWSILKLWDGGMSFHGGAVGVSLAIVLFARRHGLDWLRVHDYVACTVPIGLFFGRLANFVNGELWGKPSGLPWAMVFPGSHDGLARHPSQLYEAGLEGLALFTTLAILFWFTDARRKPGLLVGAFLIGYGLARFTVEFFREPDAQLVAFAARTGLHMGQWLTLPMFVGGVYLIASASRRKLRREPYSPAARQ
ncbi:prolipoprotein diacylglyceryl transferase [Sphingomonas sp. MA1305]|uniref:prolipoprotein diacylglyceryl transferase n=1 Tax=unclassified Sphingomonas TaxID=196159 RepID=UPI0018DFA97A|nr:MULTISPECIES: prolipoprotein diacylglyceryl transferase [unclassified Sphingomonas]MBI0476986.1 prolipoprotein diacylglyceryl transferase [Sphingomonas sp. MA1305]MCP4025514.1 prolipoprotein diacylglyceryl transferase [Sphingomonas sp.]